MSPVDRRIKRIEEKLRNRSVGPNMAKTIRERRNNRLLVEGKEPDPVRPPMPSLDERGRPLKLAEIIRQGRAARLAL